MRDPPQSGDAGQQLRDMNEALLRSSVRQHELTEQAQNAEAKLGQSEARQAYLLKLSDALRPIGDPIKILGEACRLLGEHLGVDRASYVEINEAADLTVVRHDYVRGGLSSLAGEHALSTYGWVIAMYRTGRAIVVSDIRNSDLVREADRSAMAASDVVSVAAVPLVKDGVLAGALAVANGTLREWTDADVDLVRETADRIWAAIERARAEAALRESEDRFRSFAENSADTFWIANAETGELEYLSPAFERLWGEPREVMMRDSGRWAELIHPEDRQRVKQAFPRAVAGETRAIEYRIVRPSDGRVCWVRDTGFPMRDAHGRVRHVAGVAQDITEQRGAAEHQRLLLAELQHRVRNTLAVVRSIARRTGETSDTVEDYAMHLDGRLNAFARTQAMVTRNPAAGIDLEHMVAEELVSYHAHEGKQVRIAGPPVLLRAKAAETFALAVHELATNAVKYGALSGDEGRIAVAWTVAGSGADRRLTFEWAESGISLDGAAPQRKGFGMELLERTLGYEFGATTSLAFRRNGLHCRIELPLTERIALAEEDTG